MKKYFLAAAILSIVSFFYSCQSDFWQPDTYHFLVGSYTSESFNADGKGIYSCTVDTETGAMTREHVFENAKNPSYVAVHPNGRFVYAVNETGGENPGYISAYRLTEERQLEFINEKYTRGDYPCHLSISQDDKFVLVANYGGGSVTVFPIEENGSLGNLATTVRHSGKGPFEERQEGAHAHYFGPGINDSSLFAVDLGIDKIIHYQLKDDGRLRIKSATKTAEGTGPRHLVFHPTLNSCYVILEFTCQIESYRYTTALDPFEKFQTVNILGEELPFYSSTASAIKIHPSGKFLYAAVRGLTGAPEDSIGIFSIDPQTASLAIIGKVGTGGKVPRDFSITPAGELLIVANQETGNLVSFFIDSESGLLTPTGQQLEIGTPTCVQFLK